MEKKKEEGLEIKSWEAVKTQQEIDDSSNGEVIVYQLDNKLSFGVRIINDMVWLNRQQLALLFDRDIKTIGKHISNALKEELNNMSSVAKIAIVQNEGNRTIKRLVEFYNLDMIISVGYRVKSNRGILFRQWANRILKEYLLNGYSVNNRLNNLENRVAKTEKQIEFFVKTSLPPTEGIFYDGQIFDAYLFVSELIKKASQRIVLIDNYVDATVLTMLDKRSAAVTATIYTQKISPQLKLDLEKHNSQYQPIEIREFNKAHDRFLIIDEEVYHIGASLKDLGKKWFAFSLLKDTTSEELLSKIQHPEGKS